MSYSFAVRAATKAEALLKVEKKLNDVMAGQTVHFNDRQQAYAAAEAFIEIVPQSDDHDYSVSVNGSIGWTGDGDDRVITGAGFSISVSLVAKEVAAA